MVATLLLNHQILYSGQCPSDSMTHLLPLTAFPSTHYLEDRLPACCAKTTVSPPHGGETVQPKRAGCPSSRSRLVSQSRVGGDFNDGASELLRHGVGQGTDTEGLRGVVPSREHGNPAFLRLMGMGVFQLPCEKHIGSRL